MNERLNIGVVGLGRMGQRHAMNLLNRVPRARLFSVCSPALEEIDWAKKNLEPEGVKVFSETSEMMDFSGIEAVVIASPTHLHMDHTLAALQRGIHVLCEKPITTDLDLLRNLIDTVRKTPHIKVMTAFMRRFDLDYQRAIQEIQLGSIGTPIIVRSQGAEKLNNTGSYVDYLCHSGGIFVDAAIHDIDLTLALLGEDVKPKALWATGVIAHHHTIGTFGDVDNSIGVVEFWGGKVAYFYHSRTAAHGYDNCTEIVGTEGKISINLVPIRDRLQLSSSSGISQQAIPGWSDRYCEAFVTELNEFTEAVLEERELPLGLEAAYTGLQVALALQESLRTGEKIDFDENGARMDVSKKKKPV
ncbi:unnamed protein product [Penicillium salamii]|nr:unnamed protein product [Penicillium salamii]